MNTIRKKRDSSQKDERSNHKHRSVNNSRSNNIKTLFQKAMKLVENKADHQEIMIAFREYESAIMSAARKGTLHPRNASRNVYRLNKNYLEKTSLLEKAGKFEDNSFKRENNNFRFNKKIKFNDYKKNDYNQNNQDRFGGSSRFGNSRKNDFHKTSYNNKNFKKEEENEE